MLFFNTKNYTTVVNPVVTTVTSNIYVPEYRTKYITKMITIDNTIVDYIIINSSNAEELANKFQNDLLHFENDPLNISIDSYELGQENISASANLYYRYWKLNIHNNYVQKQNLLDVNFLYNIIDRDFQISISKEIFNFNNIPIGLGVSL